MSKYKSYHIRILEKDYKDLLTHLLGNPLDYEEGAFLLAGRIRGLDKLIFLVRQVIPIPLNEIISQSSAHLDGKPEFIAKVLKTARRESLSVIQVHSHPFSKSSVSFSSRDNFGEKELFPKILQRVPGVEHVALVFGQSDNFKGRVWLPDGKTIIPIASLRLVGPVIKDISPISKPKLYQVSDPTFDRQIQALGLNGHYTITNLTVGIVGLGGNGSQVVQALVRMGVGKIIAVDPDNVEKHNIPCLIGARKEDTDNRALKVDVMKRLVEETNNTTKFIGISEPVESTKSLNALKGTNIIFCCTDNFASRDLLNNFAYLYLIPVIDMGLEFQPDKSGNICRAGGYIVTIIPGYLCLHSLNIITKETLLKEKEQTQCQGYLGEKEKPTGQVLGFNGLVAYHAIIEFLNMIIGFRENRQPTYLVIDFLKNKEKRIMTKMQPCSQCKNLLGFGEIKEVYSNQ